MDSVFNKMSLSQKEQISDHDALFAGDHPIGLRQRLTSASLTPVATIQPSLQIVQYGLEQPEVGEDEEEEEVALIDQDKD
jgi:hypothetical protein